MEGRLVRPGELPRHIIHKFTETINILLADHRIESQAVPRVEDTVNSRYRMGELVRRADASMINLRVQAMQGNKKRQLVRSW